MTVASEEWLVGQVQAAVAGNAVALDQVLRAVKDDVYRLALRMLFHPADAEDATQEVLLRITTRLSTFEGRARFRTWVYRLSVRALLNFRRARLEPVTFDGFADQLLDGLQETPPPGLTAGEQSLLEREIRLACTTGMLLCLDREHRMAYLLGVVVELEGEEAARCLGVTNATYRKRLSRARQRVEDFTRSHCGLVSPRAPCTCAARIGPALRTGCVDPRELLFATHPVAEVEPHVAGRVVDALERLPGALAQERAAMASDEVMRRHPAYLAPERLLTRLRDRTTSRQS